MFKGAYGRFAIKFDTFMIHIADKSHINYNMECQKEYFIFCLAGFLFTCVVGTFSHFFINGRAALPGRRFCFLSTKAHRSILN